MPRKTLGKYIFDLGNNQWDIPDLHVLLNDILIQNDPLKDFEVRHDFQDIGRKIMLLNARKIDHVSASGQAILLAFEDITDRRRSEEELLTMTLTDPLTNLYNRRGLFALGEKLIANSRREESGFFLLFIDLNNLKTINDRFGHEKGDLALIDTARALGHNFRSSDIIARIGGDEFVVVPAGTAGDTPSGIRSRLQKAVETSNLQNGHPFTLSLSAGIAFFDPKRAQTLKSLLAEADVSMYKQKHLLSGGSGQRVSNIILVSVYNIIFF